LHEHQTDSFLFDFTRDFTMTGTISLAGTFSNNQELSKIEFYMGCK